MKISCCWLYAITKYGYPPSLDDMVRALSDMKALGFKNVELEGVRRDNLLAVYAKRHELKKFCDGEGLRVINFCPVLPGSVSLNRKERRESWDLFKRAIEIATLFGCRTIQGDSFTPPLKFRGDSPYKRSEEHTSELQSLAYLVCRLLLEKKKISTNTLHIRATYTRNTSTSLRLDTQALQGLADFV